MRIAVFLLAAGACGRSTPERGDGFGAGDAYLAIEGDTLMRFTATRVSATEVAGEVFGSHRAHPRDRAIPVRELGAARCPPAGRIALVKTTDQLWDHGLSVGGDGERCYLQERTQSSQRDPAIVYELPARYEPAFAAARADLEARWARRTWVPKWPAGWHPEVGIEVVVRVAGGLRPAKVSAQRPGAVQIARGGAFSSDVVEEWRSPRQVAPVPPPGARPASGAFVCRGDDERACVELVPAAAAALPVVALADADVIGRSLLVNDLLLELGAIHTRRADGKVVWVRPDGTPVLEARYEVALARDGQGAYAMGWTLTTGEPTLQRPAEGTWPERRIAPAQVLELVERLARIAQPVSYDKLGDDVVFVYAPRIVLPADDPLRAQLGAAARRVLADLAR